VIPALLTAARLIDGVNELVLLPTDETVGLWLVDLDLGFPEIREVVQARPGRDGNYDHTMWHGARTITCNLVADNVAILDRLGGFMKPAARPILRFTAGGTERQAEMRVTSYAAPLATTARRGIIDISAQWSVPTGRIKSAAEHEITAFPTGLEEGRVYDLDHDRAYPPTSGVGNTTVHNAGNDHTPILMRIYGPCTDPKIENRTVGAKLETSGLVLNEGEYVEIDSGERTVYFQSDPAQSLYDRVDFAVSDWFYLDPGVNVLRFYPEASAPPCQIDYVWRDSWV